MIIVLLDIPVFFMYNYKIVFKSEYCRIDLREINNSVRWWINNSTKSIRLRFHICASYSKLLHFY
jgi:hypothetical protein